MKSSDPSPSPPVSVRPSLEAIIEASPMIEVKPLPGMQLEGTHHPEVNGSPGLGADKVQPKCGMTSHRTRILLSPANKNTIIENSINLEHLTEDNIYNTLEEPVPRANFHQEHSVVTETAVTADSTATPSPIYETINDTLERKLQQISDHNQVEANIIQVSVVESDLDNDEPPQVFSYYTLTSSIRRNGHPHCCGVSTAPSSRRGSSIKSLPVQPRRSHSLTPTFGRKVDSKFDHQAALKELAAYVQKEADSTSVKVEPPTRPVPKVKRQFSLNLPVANTMTVGVGNPYQRSPSCPILPTRNPGMRVPHDEAKGTVSHF